MASHSVKINSEITLHYAISGPETSSSPTLIFLHYWGGSSHTYQPLISHLTPTQKAIAIDFRGWGSSTGPSSPEAYSILDLATDVESLITKLGIKEYVLIGHSMGGKVAQLVAGRRRVEGLRGVVLIAPAPPTPLVLPEEMREQQNTLMIQLRMLNSSCGTLVDDMLKGNQYAKAAWPSYAMAEDILVEAKEITVPVLVVAGSEDKVEILEKVRSETVGNIKGAEIVVVEGVGT